MNRTKKVWVHVKTDIKNLTAVFLFFVFLGGLQTIGFTESEKMTTPEGAQSSQGGVSSSEDETVKQLNHLLEIVRDGEKGYAESAEGVKQEEFAAIFMKHSEERKKYAAELEQAISKLTGATPGEGPMQGSVTGATHRGWINLKTALSTNDRKAVLNEVIRGEEAAIKTYDETLQNTKLPDDVRKIVQRQADGVRAAYQHMQELASQTQTTK
jgi:uncharacterized protein (TIGR02284 family)